VRSDLLRVLDVADTPVMRMWNIFSLQAKLLSPAAEAFRYFILENGEAHVLANDAPLLAHIRARARPATAA